MSRAATAPRECPAGPARDSPRTTRAGLFGSGADRRFGRKNPWVREVETNGGNTFAGKWSRIPERTVGLIEGYIARGHSPEKAAAHACGPYVQTWRSAPPAKADPGSNLELGSNPAAGLAARVVAEADQDQDTDRRPNFSNVTTPPQARDGTQWELVTYNGDGITPRRYLVYLLGSVPPPAHPSRTSIPMSPPTNASTNHQSAVSGHSLTAASLRHRLAGCGTSPTARRKCST